MIETWALELSTETHISGVSTYSSRDAAIEAMNIRAKRDNEVIEPAAYWQGEEHYSVLYTRNDGELDFAPFSYVIRRIDHD